MLLTEVTLDEALARGESRADFAVGSFQRTWLEWLQGRTRPAQRLRGKHRQRVKQALKAYTRSYYEASGQLPSETETRKHINQEVGFSVLTALWIGYMLVNFLATLRELLKDD